MAVCKSQSVSCRLKRLSSGPYIAFFLVSQQVEDHVSLPCTPPYEPFKPHRLVFMEVNKGADDALCRVADAPKVFPASWPIGCFVKPLHCARLAFCGAADSFYHSVQWF